MEMQPGIKSKRVVAANLINRFCAVTVENFRIRHPNNGEMGGGEREGGGGGEVT